MKKTRQIAILYPLILQLHHFFSVPFSRCIKKVFSLFYLVHDFDPNITFTYSDGVPRVGFENFEKYPPKNNNKFQ